MANKDQKAKKNDKKPKTKEKGDKKVPRYIREGGAA